MFKAIPKTYLTKQKWLNESQHVNKYTRFCRHLPCNLRASRRTFSIRMSEMGQSQFQLPTVKKISLINGEDKNNRRVYVPYSFSSYNKMNDSLP